jgi:hypothetical protein
VDIHSLAIKEDSVLKVRRAVQEDFCVTAFTPPRICSVPPQLTSLGREAIELAASAGLVLDPWQQYVLDQALGRRGSMWSAFEVGLVVARQNGKGAILEARELAGLFLFGEKLIIHSAHELATSKEHFLRIISLVEGNDEFTRRVKSVSRTNGDEGIELYGPKGSRISGGQRLKFRSRSTRAGRGFSGDLVVLDEAMILSEATLGAILPVVSARPNPQVWYTGSAVDQFVHEDGVVFARLRERGIKGGDPSACFMEWSTDAGTPDDVTPAMAVDPAVWASANPGLGVRIAASHVANEQRSMDARTFAVERCSAGDWPPTDGTAGGVIDPARWDALADFDSKIAGSLVLAFDVAPDRHSAAVAAAGTRPDGTQHVEVLRAGRGTGWVVNYVAEKAAKHNAAAVICDAASPAASLLHQFADFDIEVDALSAPDHAKACGLFFDLVAQKAVRHLGTAELSAAVRGATKRPLGDAWAWSRRSSLVDISPLVAATLALWGAATDPGEGELLMAYA